LKVFTLGNSALGIQGFVTYGTQTESKKKKKNNNNNTVHEEKRLGGGGGGGGERKAVWARGGAQT